MLLFVNPLATLLSVLIARFLTTVSPSKCSIDRKRRLREWHYPPLKPINTTQRSWFTAVSMWLILLLILWTCCWSHLETLIWTNFEKLHKTISPITNVIPGKNTSSKFYGYCHSIIFNIWSMYKLSWDNIQLSYLDN